MTRGGALQLTMPCFHWQIWWILDSGRFRRHYHIIMFWNYFEPWKCAFLHVNLHPVFPEQNIVLSLRLLNLYQIVSHFTSFQPGNFQGIVSPLTINSTVMSHLAPSASKHRILRVLLYVKHGMALRIVKTVVPTCFHEYTSQFRHTTALCTSVIFTALVLESEDPLGGIYNLEIYKFFFQLLSGISVLEK